MALPDGCDWRDGGGTEAGAGREAACEAGDPEPWAPQPPAAGPGSEGALGAAGRLLRTPVCSDVRWMGVRRPVSSTPRIPPDEDGGRTTGAEVG